MADREVTMDKRARTPIAEYEDYLAIELPGDGPPGERDGLTDQAMAVVYDRLPRRPIRWRLRGLHFDRDQWSRSAVRRWWAAHEVHFLADDQLDDPIPQVCRAYPAPDANLPTIVLCHRNTPLVPARQQMKALGGKPKHGAG